MRKQKLVIFDDLVTQTKPDQATYSSSVFNHHLGKFDRFSFECIVDNVISSSTLDVFIEHSPDGDHWVHQNGTKDKPPVVGQGDVAWPSLSTTAVNLKVGESGTGPLFALARFQIFFGVLAGTAHVKISVTPRDSR
jgi:hypothetical protein